MSFTNFLEEAYSPILKLIRSEINKEKLSRLGITKNSKLVKISMKDAKSNNEDLILFANMFPSGEEESAMGKPILMAGKKMTKAREKLASENIPSVWIGWKKGEGKGTRWKKDTSSTTEPNGNFEVLRPKEAKEAGKCDGVDCLYQSDFAYKILNPEKEELLRKFRKENPDRKDFVSKGSVPITTNPNILYRFTINKLIKMLDKNTDKINKNIINTFDVSTKPLKDGNIQEISDIYLDTRDEANDSIISMLYSLKPTKLDKKEIEKWFNKMTEKYEHLR